MESVDVTKRSFEFAARIVRLCRFFDGQDRFSQTMASQLLRSGTSIGANIGEAQAGQSRADFVSKISISCKEARETLYWLRLLEASESISAEKLRPIAKEADELVRLLTSIVKSAQNSLNRKR